MSDSQRNVWRTQKFAKFWSVNIIQPDIIRNLKRTSEFIANFISVKDCGNYFLMHNYTYTLIFLSILARISLVFVKYTNTYVKYTNTHITETWLNDKIPSSLVCLGNYVFVRKDQCDSRSGDGVAILCRDDWKVKNLDFDNNLECVWCEIVTLNTKYYVASVSPT